MVVNDTKTIDGYTWALLDTAPSSLLGDKLAGTVRLESTVEHAVLRGLNLTVTSEGATPAAQFIVAARSSDPLASGAWIQPLTFLATVFPGDPMATLLSMPFDLQVYFDGITALSPHVLPVVFDPSGAAILPQQPACELAEAEDAVEDVVPVTSAAHWRVVVGQCPQYAAAFRAASSKSTAAWVYVGSIAASVMTMMFVSALTRVSWERQRLRMATGAKQGDGSQAHMQIISCGE